MLNCNTNSHQMNSFSVYAVSFMTLLFANGVYLHEQGEKSSIHWDIHTAIDVVRYRSIRLMILKCGQYHWDRPCIIITLLVLWLMRLYQRPTSQPLEFIVVKILLITVSILWTENVKWEKKKKKKRTTELLHL